MFLFQFVCMLCVLRVSCESVWHGAGNEPLYIIFLFMHLICLLLTVLLCCYPSFWALHFVCVDSAHVLKYYLSVL
jgi:hypothetical protein